ncbi:MAG: hypothetical protein HZA18_02375 [Nitrospirae bacterium]|nr:hypothetical protein [Nitrospirota bacterium]
MVLSILVFAAVYIGTAAGRKNTISMDHLGTGAGKVPLRLNKTSITIYPKPLSHFSVSL